MLDTDTKRRIDTARDILVGKVPDPKSQVEQITIALIYKFMDDMDKESVAMGGKASFFTGDFERYAWSKIFDPRLGGFEMLAIYSEAILKMNQNPNIPQLFRDIFKNAYLPYRDPETLKLFLKTINEFSYDHSERLGDAFEYLLSVLGSQGQAGQFRTPRHIIDFMVQVVNPQKYETVLDPACGTAGFLISSYKHILKENTQKYPGDLLTGDEAKKLYTNFKGYDISPDMVRLSLVNLYLHGFAQPQIIEYDTLTSEDRWNEYADVIMANPPFMSPKGGIKPHKRFSVQSNRSEVLFVDYIAEHLTPTGRAAVIVPEGIIFQSARAYKQLRKMLVENFLYAVVSQPAGIFNPYSGVKTSILLMDKQLAKKTDSILFVKVENDGFGLGAQRREQAGSDLPDTVNAIVEWQRVINMNIQDEQEKEGKISSISSSSMLNSFLESGLAMLVKKDKLAENGEYNLTGDRYRTTKKSEHQKWPLVRLGDLCIEMKSGFACGKSDKNKGDILHLRPMNISPKGRLVFEGSKYIDKSEYDISYSIKKRDVLFNNTNSKELVGKTCYISNDFENTGYSNHITRIRTNQELNPQFLSLLLHNKFEKGEFLLLCNKWVGQAGVNNKNLSAIQIPLPPIEVQREIVAEIEGYQKIIDGARQVVDNWKPHIEIDPQWPVVKLGDVCDVKAGGTPPTTEKIFYDNGNIPWLKSEACKDKFIEESNTYITVEGLNNSSAKILKKNTTLIALVGATIGKTGFLTFEASTNQNVVGLYPNNPNDLNEQYLYYSAQRLYSKFLKLGDGNFKMANLSFIKSLEIFLPPLKIQQEIVAKIETERKIIDSCRELIKIYEDKIKRVIDKVWE